MSFLFRRLIGGIRTSEGGGGASLVAWPGVQAGGSFQVLGSYHQNMIAGVPGSGLGPVVREVTGVTWAAGSATITTNIVHLLYTNMWVELSGVLGATGANGTWKVATVPSSTTFTVVMPDPGTWSAGGTQWMNLIVPKRLSYFPHLSVIPKIRRGAQAGANDLATTNYYVPYGLDAAVVAISTAADSGGLVKITTRTNHGFSTGNVVEITGLRASDYVEYTSVNGGVQHVQGVWTITVVDADEFTLDGSVWPTGATITANTGIVELHANAVSQRAALLSGGTANPSDVSIDDYQDTDDLVRSYKQAASRYRDFLYGKTGWHPGYYFSSSCVGTPYEVTERGGQGSYPFALVNLDSDYTNGWGISTSQTNSGNLQLTLAKTPPAWTSSSTVYAAIFNHSNPTHGMDRFLDKADAFARLRGFRGTATSGTTTVLTDSGAAFDYKVLGRHLHIVGGTRSGESRLVIAFTGTTLTVSPAFGGALDNTSQYIAGSLAHPISSVSGDSVTLRVPYASADGTGGCVVFMGQLANSSCITDSTVSNGAGGTYALLTTKDSHGLVAGNFVSVHNTATASGDTGRYNFRVSSSFTELDPSSTRTTVYKVLSAPSATTVVVDKTYSVNADRADTNNAWWIGSCLSMKPTVSATTDWTTGTLRCDSPDFRHADVRTLFVNDQKAMLDAVYARDGIRHIGLFDENALRQTASAASTLVNISGTACGETIGEAISRLGELGTYLRTTYGTMFAPNTSSWFTKDTVSAANIAAIASTWGGFTSEIACMLWDRSYYQMVEGWLSHINTLVSSNGCYYYQPQERTVASTALAAGTNTGDSSGYLKATLVSDAGFFPTQQETLATGHNHSGHLIGIYGCTANAVNGVHRVRGTNATGTYDAFLETRYAGATHDNTDGTGVAVYSNCAAPFKILGLTDSGTASAGGTLWLATTEFPHGLPSLDEGDVWVKMYGYGSSTAAIPNGTLIKADVKSPTTFEIANGTTHGYTLYERIATDDTTDGIGFHLGNNSTTYGADEEHWYGISYMLWQPGYALYFNRGALNRHVTHNVSHENVHGWLPSGLTPDSTYSVVNHTGTADSGTTTTITDAAAAFTDAVLGEQVAIIAGTNSGEWRRVTSRTTDTLTVDAAFSGAIDNTSQYYVGKTVTGDVQKVLELKRTFDGATKTVQVFPQKTYVTYTGFTWDTDA